MPNTEIIKVVLVNCDLVINNSQGNSKFYFHLYLIEHVNN